MSLYKERQFWMEFIELYKNKPELWKIKHENYKDRMKKNAAYEALIQKCKEFEPLADKNYVVKKISSFRAVYRRELKRCKQKLNSGKEYIPSLWYFNHMNFLRNQEEYLEGERLELDFVNESNRLQNKLKESEPKLKKVKHNCSTDELVRLATQRLKSSQDSCHQVATVWANKMSKMDRNQRLFAEKVMNEVIFNGELGLLKYNTTLTNISSVGNKNVSSSSLSKSKTMINTSDSSQESRLSNYTVNFDREQNDEILSDEESVQSGENYIVEEYDPLNDSIKLED